MVGSAQRRRGGAILQHGSVLLARSSSVPELPGVCDVADAPIAPEYWRAALEVRIPAELCLEPIGIEWPDSLRERARDLERSMYRSRAWTEAR